MRAILFSHEFEEMECFMKTQAAGFSLELARL